MQKLKLSQEVCAQKYATMKWEKPVSLWHWEDIFSEKKPITPLDLDDLKDTLSDVAGLEKKGVKFYTLKNAPKHLKDFALERFSSHKFFHRLDYFGFSKSKSFFIVTVPKNVSVDLSLLNSMGEQCVQLFVFLDEGAVARVSETLHNNVLSHEIMSFGSTFLYFTLSKNARLDYFFASINQRKHHAYRHVYLLDDAQVNFYPFLKAKNYEHIACIVEHAGMRTKARMIGLLDSWESARVYLRLINHHVGDNTFGEIIFHALARDVSLMHIDGLIHIEKGAKKTESHLQERALITTEEALIRTVPNLEILNNDVICTHSASIGNIDEAMISYMTSRGVSEEDARKLIMNGYFRSLIVGLPDEYAKQVFARYLHEFF